MTSAFKQHNIPWKSFFFFSFTFVVLQNLRSSQTRNTGCNHASPVHAQSIPSCREVSSHDGAGAPPSTAALQLAYTFPTRLHFSHSLAAKIGKFLYLVPGEVLITTPMSYIYLSLQPHLQHQLHALHAQNVEARTLQWHHISFVTDFTVAGLHIILGKGVIINQNLF